MISFDYLITGIRIRIHIDEIAITTKNIITITTTIITITTIIAIVHIDMHIHHRLCRLCLVKLQLRYNKIFS